MKVLFIVCLLVAISCKAYSGPYDDYYDEYEDTSHPPHEQQGQTGYHVNRDRSQPLDPYRRYEKPEHSEPHGQHGRSGSEPSRSPMEHEKPLQRPYERSDPYRSEPSDPYRSEHHRQHGRSGPESSRSATEHERPIQRPYERPDPHRAEPSDPYKSEPSGPYSSEPFDPYRPYERPIDPTQPEPYVPFERPTHRERSAISTIVDISGLGSVSSRLKRTIPSGIPIHSFENLRYAESPRGVKRFQAPESVRPWKGVFDGSKERIPCPSFLDLSHISATENFVDVEDCLRLSVYTKNVSGNYPIMVYVHGEFFFDGSSEEAPPEYLLERDIVLVSIQYRLAPIGFLSTLSNKIPGNIAVLDIVAGLQWVHNNIRWFGGDPRSVTIFGQSAGAALVHVLTFSPVVPHGLFHRVILQSGSALSPFFITEHPFKHSKEIARHAGCPISDRPGSFDDCLINLQPSQLLTAFMRYGQVNEHKGFEQFGGFQLAVYDRNIVLPQHPRVLLQRRNIQSYPMIVGVTRNIGSFLYKKIAEIHQHELLRNFNFDRITSIFINYLLPEYLHSKWQNIFQEQLIVDPDYSHNITVVAPSLIDLCGDAVYKVPVFEAAEINRQHMPHNTFLYTFDFKGRYNRFNHSINARGLHFQPGVSLSDDNIYIFPYPRNVAILNNEELTISGLVIDLWTSFAKSGWPSSGKISHLYWQPASGVEGPYLKIDISSDLKYNLKEELFRTAMEYYLKIHRPY